MHELEAAQTAAFVEVNIGNWNAIPVSDRDSIYGTPTALLQWGHKWYLKVDKAVDGRIGLYLCCSTIDDDETSDGATRRALEATVFSSVGTDAGAATHLAASPTVRAARAPNVPATGSTPAAPTTGASASLWPAQVDYQLMARRRATDEAVCCSVHA